MTQRFNTDSHERLTVALCDGFSQLIDICGEFGELVGRSHADRLPVSILARRLLRNDEALSTLRSDLELLRHALAMREPPNSTSKERNQ